MLFRSILTGACEGTDGAIKLARKMVEERPDVYYMPDQFSNPNNPLAHYETTGPEIMHQTDGQIDVLVAGLGTTGTLMGTGKYLREKKPGVKIIAVEPTVGHKIQGLKNMTESMVPQIYNKSFPDETINVGDEEAFETTRLLAIKEGIFVGMSSGAALWGAIQVAKTMSGGMIVVILPDKGDRYLSTNLFKSVCAKCPP